MAGISSAVEWAGKHPVTVAVGVFALGAVFLLFMRGSSSGTGDGGMSAFYAAQAAQAASGNQLMAVQAQGKTATAIAQIAADRDVQLADYATQAAATQVAGGISLAEIAAAASAHAATVQSQTDIQLAQYNRDVLMASELTRQQAQKQQFYLNAGIQQIYGQTSPYLLQLIGQGGQQAAAAVEWIKAAIAGQTTYNAAH